jgi:hypothetical protein
MASYPANPADDALDGKNITMAGASASEAGLAFSGNYSGYVGVLTLNANSIIDFGQNSVVAHFLAIANLDQYILKIYNWSGTTLWDGGTGNNTDQIYFDSGTSGNLNQISFYSDFGNSFLGTGYQIMSGEFASQILPVPEPETWVTCVLLILGSAIWFSTKSRRKPRSFTS